MATMFTELSGNETSGEKTLYNRFNSKLPDEYMIWHNKVLSQKNREIDFIILHPNYGLWVIEVKDWAVNQILKLDDQICEIVVGGKSIKKRSPLYQSWQNKNFIKEILARKSNLLHKDGYHKGKLILPINNLAVLSNITINDIDNEPKLVDRWRTKQVWTGDFLDNSFSSGTDWEKQLHDSREFAFQCSLNISQIDTIKSAIGVPVVFSPTTGNVIGTLDDHQEKLVRHKIEKQIIIEGPAGSGKSIVLLKRAIHIHETYPHWQIGIICFNALMANYLRIMLRFEENGRELHENIDIFDIYNWANNIGLPNIKGHYRSSKTPDAALTQAFQEKDGHVSKQYDALLIDEGQDSTDTMLQIYHAMLRNSEGSFTFFFDKRQTLYYTGSFANRLQEYGFNIAKEKELVKQQRSVLVLLALGFYEKLQNPSAEAKTVMHEVFELCEKMFFNVKNLALAVVTGLGRLFGMSSDSKHINFKTELEKAVLVRQVQSAEEMVKEAINQITLEYSHGEASYGDFLIIYPSRNYNLAKKFDTIDLPSIIQVELQNEGIPFVYIHNKDGLSFDGNDLCTEWDNRRTANLTSDSVKVMTIHASKGYDATNVFVLGFDNIDLPTFQDHRAELGYVAITRAKKRCHIYYCVNTPVISHLLKIMATLQ